MLGRHFIHSSTRIHIMNQDEAARFHHGQTIVDIPQCALKCMVPIHQIDIHLLGQLLRDGGDDLLRIAVTQFGIGILLNSFFSNWRA